MKSEAQRGEIWRIGEDKKKWADHSDVEFIDFSFAPKARIHFGRRGGTRAADDLQNPIWSNQWLLIQRAGVVKFFF